MFLSFVSFVTIQGYNCAHLDKKTTEKSQKGKTQRNTEKNTQGKVMESNHKI